MGFTALQLCPTPDGLIPWQTIEHAIAKADDLATLSRIKNALDAFKILARQKADAIQTHNTIMKYLDDIDEKRWVLKHEAGIKRGGPKTRPVSLAEINMTKRGFLRGSRRPACRREQVLGWRNRRLDRWAGELATDLEWSDRVCRQGILV
jgi:hypothetical protein